MDMPVDDIVGIPMPDLLRMHEDARAELAALQKKFDTDAADLKDTIDATETLMLDFLVSQGTAGASIETDTHNITIKKDIKDQYSIADRGAFNDWVIANDAANVFQARINVAALNQITEELPPGVNVFRKAVVAIRRTVKKL